MHTQSNSHVRWLGIIVGLAIVGLGIADLAGLFSRFQPASRESDGGIVLLGLVLILLVLVRTRNNR